MIEAIREIGEYTLKKDKINPEDPQGLIEIFCENLQGKSPNPPHILTIEFIKNDDLVSFTRVINEEYKKANNPRYLYRFGSSRGTNVTPTSKVTDIGKTYRNKIKSWFDQDFSRAPYLLEERDLNLIKSMKECLNTNETAIKEQIEEFLLGIRAKKESAVVTCVISEKNIRQYFGDIDIFRTIFIKKTRASLSQKYKTESRGENKICSVCRKKKDEVFGFVSTYNFYTVDKPGMVSGGFDQSQAWKNYPVCLECALALECGKKYLENYSRFRFYGFDYYVIPKSLYGDQSGIFETLKTFQSEGDRIKLSDNYQVLMSDTKDEILNHLSGKDNSFLCNILIYQENNNEFKIERYIEDIFPSRLKELFDAKKTVDGKPILQSLQVPVFNDDKKVGKRTFEFNFESIYYFFGKEIDHDARTYFLDIVSRIFSGKEISYPFILSGIIRKNRKIFVQNLPTKLPTEESSLRGLALLTYLNELELLGSYQDGITMTNQSKSIVADTSSDTYKKSEAIFQEFPAFFNASAKRAVFLEGVLCQKLLNIQYRERKSTPFRTKLQSLKLDQNRIQSLFPEIQNKLEEYKANYYRDLERLISASMMESGNDWKLSKDEIAFYFLIGMNLADQFAFEKQDDGVKKDE
jgi:CRISPR-associated protein Csh1